MATRIGSAVGLAVFLFSWTLTTHGKFSVSGDEPHYLMIAESLRSDGDLDLANNYAHDDARLFGHAGLEMGTHARMSRTGRLRSMHDVGLPFALLPAYVVAQRLAAFPSDATLQRFRMNRGLFAYSIVSLALMAATACAAGLFAGAVETWTGSRAAALAAAVAAMSPPIVGYTFLVFPETIALSVTLLVVSFALARVPHGTLATIGIALLLGLLPWVHRKYSFYVFGLLFVVVWKQQASVRRLSAAGAVAAVTLFLAPQVALHAWIWHEWGTLGGPQMQEGVLFSAAGLGPGLAGLWLDRTYGALACGPIFLLAPAFCWLEWKKTWPFLVAAALLYVPVAAFKDWSAGFSPAARYIVPVLPLVLLPIAAAMRRPVIRKGFMALAAAQALIDAAVWQHPRALWPGAPRANGALEMLGPVGRMYERILPSIWTDGLTRSAGLVVLAIALGSAALVVAARMRDRRAGPLPMTI